LDGEGNEENGSLQIPFLFIPPHDIFLENGSLHEMTTKEFQKKVIELLRKYRMHGRMKERIIPLFTMAESLNQEEMKNIYRMLEEAVVAQKEAERLSDRLNSFLNDFNRQDVSSRLNQARPTVDGRGGNENNALIKSPRFPPHRESGKVKQNGNAMKYNKQSGGKPTFGLKLNKLFAAFITEYGPDYVTMIISDSILYTNNLILRIALKKNEVLIGSSKSLRLYESVNGASFLITEKPEVIPYGSSRGFFFKNITYEDILNLTNGDFFKVFDPRILEQFKEYETSLPDELQNVGYYRFD
jgi:hypothetical protein